MTQRNAYIAVGALLQLVVAACAPAATTTAEIGNCVLDSNITCNTDFDGFTCTGTARPDQNADFRVGAIEGTVCTSLGTVDTSTGGSYCCTSATTACGYDPGMECPTTAPSGYACSPPSRPENFDPDLACGMGQQVSGQTVFCCGTATTPNCVPDSAVQCGGPEFKAIECMTPQVPNEGELGTDQSRSNATLLCDIPAMIGGVYGYCCFTPTQPPVGASCLQDQAVPNCASGSFGFACTGPDTPDQDYSRITCPAGGGVPGMSAEGYPASLYCCTYLTADGGLL